MSPHALTWKQAAATLWRAIREDPGVVIWIVWGLMLSVTVFAGGLALIVVAVQALLSLL